MKYSGVTRPWVLAWIRSSPTAPAAFSASVMFSWVSDDAVVDVAVARESLPQTPAKQSACSSIATEYWLASCGFWSWA